MPRIRSASMRSSMGRTSDDAEAVHRLRHACSQVAMRTVPWLPRIVESVVAQGKTATALLFRLRCHGQPRSGPPPHCMGTARATQAASTPRHRHRLSSVQPRAWSCSTGGDSMNAQLTTVESKCLATLHDSQSMECCSKASTSRREVAYLPIMLSNTMIQTVGSIPRSSQQSDVPAPPTKI